MRLAIMGGTGRIGRLALGIALSQGHEVVALARHSANIRTRAGLAVVTGDLLESRAVQEAVRGVDAVIVAVGPRSNSAADEEALETGMRNIVAAMDAYGIRRLVALSGAAVDVPGDRKPLVDRLASSVVRRLARHVVAAKQREYLALASSTLDWTALRPPLVGDGGPKGYRLDLRLQPGARVTRADVAQALVDQVTDRKFIGAAPFVLPAHRH